MAKHHLTDRFVQNLTPQGTPRFRPDAWGRIEIGDVRVEGLVLRITRQGRKTWSYLYRMTVPKKSRGWHAGPQQRMTIGPYPNVSLRVAREVAMDARENVLAGVDPRASKADVLTVEDVCNAYVNKSLKGRVKDHHNFELRMRKHVLSRWGTRPITDITRADVHDLLDEVKEIGPAAARNIRKHLHAMYVWAVDREMVTINPLYRLRRDDLTPANDVRRPLTDEQIREMWNLPLRITPQLRLLLLTGCRKIEIGTSRWNQYNLEAGLFTIPPGSHKSKREIVIPLCTLAMDVLASLPRGENDVQVFEEGYLSGTLMDAAHRRISDWRLRPHDLRATVATRMSALGTSGNIVQLCLGHSIKGLLPVYSKYDYLDEKREAFEKYGDHIMEVLK